jgi:general secretion pathway protein M
VTLAERIAKLEPRERTLVFAFSGVVVAVMFLVIPIYLVGTVSDHRDENQQIRDFIEKVAESREKIESRKSARDATLARYSRQVPNLASFIEDAAKANQVEISEAQARPDVPHGKKYVEHVVSVRLKKVGLMGLAKMLEKIEKSSYPITINRFNMKPRAGEPDSFDVELAVSAYERKADPKADGKTPKEAGSAEPKNEEEEL